MEEFPSSSESHVLACWISLVTVFSLIFSLISLRSLSFLRSIIFLYYLHSFSLSLLFGLRFFLLLSLLLLSLLFFHLHSVTSPLFYFPFFSSFILFFPIFSSFSFSHFSPSVPLFFSFIILTKNKIVFKSSFSILSVLTEACFLKSFAFSLSSYFLELLTPNSTDFNSSVGTFYNERWWFG